jgi:hypothetical protein
MLVIDKNELNLAKFSIIVTMKKGFKKLMTAILNLQSKKLK